MPIPSALGVVEGDLAAIEAYKSSGGDIARQLTADEVQLLSRSSAFDVGFTLVHLAIRFQRQDMLAILLTEVSVLIDLSSTSSQCTHIYIQKTGLFSEKSCMKINSVFLRMYR